MSAGTGNLEREELRRLHELELEANGRLEVAVRERWSIARTLEDFLPAMARALGAVGAFVQARDELLQFQIWRWGAVPPIPPGGWPDGVRGEGDRVLVQRALDVVDERVGTIGLIFHAPERRRPEFLEEAVETIAEQLDSILATIEQASRKQKLILELSQALSARVFERGLDAAVAALFGALSISEFALVWREDFGTRRAIHYRMYDRAGLRFDSAGQRHAGLEDAIRAQGPALFGARNAGLREALAIRGGVEVAIIEGSRDVLGKMLVTAGETGLSVFGHDLVEVCRECVRQRLVDHYRELRHLSKFFAPPVIAQLLRDPDYAQKYLAPRETTCAILYADINSFTRLSEQVLETPERIGRFVDRWSELAVDCLWEQGGVFDKMVGDCVIGIFGPPFDDEPPAGRAIAALRAAAGIQSMTAKLGDDIFGDGELDAAGLNGLGVAIGINLCPLFVGLFGPNQDFTGFSSGMNATARLQSLAGFRETLAMASIRQAVGSLDQPFARALRFGEARETKVKNVSQPLYYHHVDLPPV